MENHCYCHIPEEKITPIILNMEEKSEDYDEVHETDEHHNLRWWWDYAEKCNIENSPASQYHILTSSSLLSFSWPTDYEACIE